MILDSSWFFQVHIEKPSAINDLQDRSVPDSACSALVICSDGCFKQFQFGVARHQLRWVLHWGRIRVPHNRKSYHKYWRRKKIWRPKCPQKSMNKLQMLRIDANLDHMLKTHLHNMKLQEWSWPDESWHARWEFLHVGKYSEPAWQKPTQ